jgi:hypothetical protein
VKVELAWLVSASKGLLTILSTAASAALVSRDTAYPCLTVHSPLLVHSRCRHSRDAAIPCAAWQACAIDGTADQDKVRLYTVMEASLVPVTYSYIQMD